MALMFRDYRPWIADLVRVINAPDVTEESREQMVSMVIKLVREDTLRTSADLVEWKDDLPHAEVAKILRELAQGIRV